MLLLIPSHPARGESVVIRHEVTLRQKPVAAPLFGTYAFGLGSRDETAGIWPCNFWSNFAIDGFTKDLQLLKLEGGNAVIVLFPFFDVDHGSAETAGRLDRLKSILEICDAEDIALTLRLGYAWDNGFAPGAPLRQLSILTDPAMRQEWYAFCRKTGELAASHPCFRGAFVSWEDFWVYLHGAGLDAAGRAAWAARIHYPADAVPARGSPAMRDYFDRFDRLFCDDFFAATQQLVPHLGLEVRMDDDPIYDGSVRVGSFVHQRMFSAPNLHDVYFYWGPFLGARNEGDQIGGDDAFALLAQAIDKVRDYAVPRARLILAQFNYVDNTPGFSRNSRIRPGDLDTFIRRSCDFLRQNDISVYTWSNSSFYFNAINNGTFARGSQFWDFQNAIVGLDQGQPCAYVLPRGTISQVIDADTFSSANLDGDGRVEVGFRAKSAVEGRCQVAIGDQVTTIAIPGGSHWTRCAATLLRIRAGGGPLRLSAPAGAALADVVVANHQQEVGSSNQAFPRTQAYVSLAWALSHDPPVPPTPVVLSGTTEDSWIERRALISTPATNGRFGCAIRLTVPSFTPSQAVQISLLPDGPMEELPLPPGQHDLLVGGATQQGSVVIALTFREQERSTTNGPDLRMLAAHFDSLGGR